jgi:predicted anti-sigma-YlaC factor YlaD
MADAGNWLECRGVVEVVTDYLEGALSPSDAMLIDCHLDSCEGCRRYLMQMRITIDTVGRLGEDDVPAEMRERLLAAFREVTQK